MKMEITNFDVSNSGLTLRGYLKFLNENDSVVDEYFWQRTLSDGVYFYKNSILSKEDWFDALEDKYRDCVLFNLDEFKKL